MLGEPTMRGRRDLTRHFFTVGYLATTTGAEAAQTAGIAKELADAQGTSGFSFADMAADRAGVRFARGVLRKADPARHAGGDVYRAVVHARSRRVCRKSIPAKDFASKYGGNDDPRFTKQLKEIDERIMRLPGYRPVGTRR